MKLGEYEKIITNTQENDWTKIICWGAGSGPSYLNSFSVCSRGIGELDNIEIDTHTDYMSYKHNLLISVAWGLIHNDDFNEDWAKKFPNRHAKSGFVDFFYSDILVFRDIYVSVDGGRCTLPLPKIKFTQDTHNVEKLVVSRKRYEFFKFLNSYASNDSYYSYVKQAGFEISDEEWMEGDGY